MAVSSSFLNVGVFVKRITSPIPSVATVVTQALIVGEEKKIFTASKQKILVGLIGLGYRRKNAEEAIKQALSSRLLYKKKGRIHVLFADK